MVCTNVSHDEQCVRHSGHRAHCRVLERREEGCRFLGGARARHQKHHRLKRPCCHSRRFLGRINDRPAWTGKVRRSHRRLHGTGAGCDDGRHENGWLMRPSKFSEQDIVQALDQVTAGTSAAQMCRDLGITQTTFYRWRKQRAGGEVTPSELRALRSENQKLREIVANFLLDKVPLAKREF